MEFPLVNVVEPTYRLALDETGSAQTAPDGSIIIVDSESSLHYRLPSCPIVWQHFGITVESQTVEENTAENEPRESQPQVQNTERRIRKADRWNHRDTLKLIAEWTSRRSRFENNYERNESLWEEIATSMGGNYSAIRCENRFKYLKRLYMETKDKNNKMTGGPEETCPYYEEFDELFANTPQVNPPALASSRDPPNPCPSPLIPPSTHPHSSPIVDPLQVEMNVDENSSGTSLSNTPSLGSHRRRRTRLGTEMSHWVSELRDEARVREDARERRHREIINLQRETNDLYREMMSKLIEKL